jgi:hypothetical protein
MRGCDGDNKISLILGPTGMGQGPEARCSSVGRAVDCSMYPVIHRSLVRFRSARLRIVFCKTFFIFVRNAKVGGVSLSTVRQALGKKNETGDGGDKNWRRVQISRALILINTRGPTL